MVLAMTLDIPALPPPGRMIDVGTHKMHLYSLGEGTPVVVMDAGAGDNLLSWWGIQSEIATFTQVVSYDRSGLGWSERGSAPRSGEAVVREMHAVLTAAQLPPPYVLVGHSMGGVHVRMFRQAYPELVAGLVLVDSSHEQQVTRFAQTVPAASANMESHVQFFRELSQKTHAEIGAQAGALFTPDGASEALAALYLDRLRPEAITTMIEEYASVAEILDQPDGFVRDLGDLPLRVLTQTTPMVGEGISAEDGALMLKVFQELQTEISTRSTRGSQTLVANSGHYIQRDQPQVVIDAVREVVEIVRQSTKS
jgi:pimeloyl-ACP methyl ester carboxylesterase